MNNEFQKQSVMLNYEKNSPSASGHQCQVQKHCPISRGRCVTETDSADIEKDAAAVSGEGREADDFQVGVDFRGIIEDFQGLAIEGGALIGAQPLGVHVREATAEGGTDQGDERQLLELGQRRISVTEDPVHGVALLVEDHLDVREREGKGVKDARMLPKVRLSGLRRHLTQARPSLPEC